MSGVGLLDLPGRAEPVSARLVSLPPDRAPLPEPERFGVVWMGREALGRAFDLDGAFNDVQLRLEPGTSERETIDAVDRLLVRHGGRVFWQSTARYTVG